MKIKREMRFNISKDLSILRAFVDAIEVYKDDIFVSVAYRKGRVFCRYGPDFKLKFRVEEEDLKLKGMGDFRCFTVDSNGNLLVAGAVRPDTITIFTIDEGGRVSSIRTIKNFSLLESIAVDGKDNLYLHSPLQEKPAYRYTPDGEPTPIGEFPQSGFGISRRMAQLAVDNAGNLVIAFETEPALLYRYDYDGNEIYRAKFSRSEPSIDRITRILDMSIDKKTGSVTILHESPGRSPRIAEIINPDGKSEAKIKMTSRTRRINHYSPDSLYASETIFGLHAMALSMQIYGAITLIEQYSLK